VPIHGEFEKPIGYEVRAHPLDDLQPIVPVVDGTQTQSDKVGNRLGVGVTERADASRHRPNGTRGGESSPPE
jgi:hypothetical protein